MSKTEPLSLPHDATMAVHALDGDPHRVEWPSLTWCTSLLRRALKQHDLEVYGCRTLKKDVYQLRLTTGGPASVVMKRLDPAAANRDCLLTRRWLPAIGLADAGPPLLGTAFEQETYGVWSFYEWLDGRDPASAVDIDRLVDVVASMHVRFAAHPLIAEVRHHGASLGAGAFVGQLHDALLALTAANNEADVRSHLGTTLVDLERAVHQVLEDVPEVLAVLDEVAGPDTLLHGDLWPQNVVAGSGPIRLIDWDRLGVGPAIYDLSTLLLRVRPSVRRRVLDRYLARVAEAGWPVPTVEQVLLMSTAFERARIATLISWRVLELLQAPTGSAASWGAEELRSIRTWWYEVDPRPEIEEEVR